MLKLKNIITHLLLVGLLPFQKRSLFSDVFAAVGTHEEADGTTTGGERPRAASEIEDANFFAVADVGGLGRQRWMARQRQRVG